MIYFLDTASLEDIKDIIDNYPISGINTNPSLIAKEEVEFSKLLKSIRVLIGEERIINIQVLGEKTMDIIEEAKKIKKILGGNIYIKIPVTKEGLKAIKILKKEEFNVIATAVNSSSKGIMAALCGADYLEIFCCENKENKGDINDNNLLKIISDIFKEINIHKLNTKLLVSNIKTKNYLEEILKIGVHGLSLNKELINDIFDEKYIENILFKFKEDWIKIYGENILIKDLL
ncbi:transaldolase family protein [Clostridium fallax]|uniref:Fructose-6-phosphate aldolase 2 n=1 Tax=Clostridium fallax TaxID=1533 RepID=A0A1M4SFH3_9CLOT|nr:transaldolase family protein [Clostridium fallax]SHE30935.1 fructose-6-phosphate aldolase 2 [Clostridium fallax]SQB07808.1 fructose-6-phosphate aldolase 2 [Clostridium fallax]